MDVLGDTELRQGPAAADRPHGAPGGPGAVPGDPGRSQRMTTRDRPIPAGATAGAAAEAPSSTSAHVLELVRARTASAEVEVVVTSGLSALTRFANSFIHQNVAEETSHVLLRVALDGHVASVSFDGPPDAQHLGRLADDAIEAARAQPLDPEWPGLTPPTPGLAVEHWDQATAVASPDERARRVRDFVDAAGGLETAGVCSTSSSVAAFQNSAGQRLPGRTTHPTLDGSARGGSSDGAARKTCVRLEDLDGRAMGEPATTKARTASDPTDLETGRYEVILEPECVSNLLSFLLAHGFNGKAVEDGRSFVRLGEPQFDPSITLRDDVTDPAMVGIPFDVEGTPKRPLDLISAGLTSGLLHNRRTARKAGTESTGHAVES